MRIVCEQTTLPIRHENCFAGSGRFCSPSPKGLIMTLFVSCLAKDHTQIRRLLDAILHAGWKSEDITVTYPGEALIEKTADHMADGPQSAVVGAGTAGVAAGALGWLIGYGVLAIPVAMIGAAIGSAAGAAVGDLAQEETAHRNAILAHYAPYIHGTHAGIVIKASDSQELSGLLQILQNEEAADIQIRGKGRFEKVNSATVRKNKN
jgi:hypothetical protein